MNLDLGSTAKLRTLAHYLGIVADLNDELARLPPDELGRRAISARDPITRWAAETRLQGGEIGLDGLLDCALARTYSASPREIFFTAGGAHQFANFDRADDRRVM